MYRILTTKNYDLWFSSLKDIKTKARINARLRRITLGNFGDIKVIDKDISELRFFFGAGYRIYITQKNNEIVILLAGGDKNSQQKDIEKAQELVKQLGELK